MKIVKVYQSIYADDRSFVVYREIGTNNFFYGRVLTEDVEQEFCDIPSNAISMDGVHRWLNVPLQRPGNILMLVAI